YPLDEAIQVLVTTEGVTKFDETVELAVKLGVDPRQADQNVRGTVVLPHGRGKAVRVVVFAKGEKAKEASEAGADHVGAEELANAQALLTSLLRAKPAASKGNYVQSIAVATTMGPSVRIDPATARAA